MPGSGGRRHRYGRYRYGPWQGGPDPLAPPYDVRQALDALGEEVLAGLSGGSDDLDAGLGPDVGSVQDGPPGHPPSSAA